LRLLERNLVDRLLHLGLRRADLPLRRGAGLHPEAEGSRQPLGRRRDDARMDAVLAAAVPPVLGTAADQVRTAPAGSIPGRSPFSARVERRTVSCRIRRTGTNA